MISPESLCIFLAFFKLPLNFLKYLVWYIRNKTFLSFFFCFEIKDCSKFSFNVTFRNRRALHSWKIIRKKKSSFVLNKTFPPTQNYIFGDVKNCQRTEKIVFHPELALIKQNEGKLQYISRLLQHNKLHLGWITHLAAGQQLTKTSPGKRV